MISPYHSVYILLLGLSFSAFLVLMLLLERGEICKGQQSRIQNQMATIASITSLSLVAGFAASVTLWALLPLVIAVVSAWVLCASKNKLKEKRSIENKLWWRFGAPLALAYAILLFSQFPASIAGLPAGLALGHCMLLRAKYRIEAFDKILPAAAAVLGMLLLVVICVIALQHEQAQLLVQHCIVYASCFLASILLWIWPLFSQRKAPAQLVMIVCLGLLVSGYAFYQISII
ncbi:hypothetical protein DBZ36_12535 [Alginatibacterium sediminis]|uniref:Uncharacterized protein n=1 Tax=Alginatibacterium sediminis TaxID=2164068 RepID=A0A420EBI8_9ALTE|nr:hypothetical protein [Alginatibacterium sediminis]RKF18060.1 hypothetical protein DBZ36_12535 [Alginatibacterium sediminis]